MTKIPALKAYFSDLKKIDYINNLLKYDQRVYMPEGSNRARSELISFVNSLKHKTLISDKTQKLIKQAERCTDLDLIDNAILREAKRAYEKAIKVSTSLIEKIEKSVTLGHKIWERARKRKDFNIFKPILEKIIKLKKEYADKIAMGETRYDTLLDDFEPGATTRWLDGLFKNLKPPLIKIVDKLISAEFQPETYVLKRYYNPEQQWNFSLKVIEKLNFDFFMGRQDKSVHPFTMAISPTDVRITTRIMDNYLPACIFGTIHECGHALYDLGFMEEIHFTNLCEVSSLGIHESQSRLWETIIGKSEEFWEYFYPILRRYFPENLGNYPKEQFHKALNKVERSFIRVEADEVTYPLHILLRYEIEKMIFEDKVEIEELPQVWNEKMEVFLNITPPDDAMGILQDVHWSGGAFGYFPSYALGNLYAAQLFHYAKEEISSLPQQISQGHFSPLLNFLREKVHKYGSIFFPRELIRRATGEILNSSYFIEYIKEKFYSLYHI
jgi:carboxypeptidase Taq